MPLGHAELHLGSFHAALVLSVVAGSFLFLVIPHRGAVLFTPEQAQKIDPDLMARIGQLPGDSTVLVWFDIEPEVEITPSIIEELSALGAKVRVVSIAIYSISAEVMVSDLPRFASLDYILNIDEFACSSPDPGCGPD